MLEAEAAWMGLGWGAVAAVAGRRFSVGSRTETIAPLVLSAAVSLFLLTISSPYLVFIAFLPLISPIMGKRKYLGSISDELPFFLAYAASISEVGISLFSSLGDLRGSPLKAIETQGARLAKLFHLYGDPASALEALAKRQKDRAFADVLSGYAFRMRTGSGAQEYLMSRMEDAMSGLSLAWSDAVERAESLGEVALAVFSMLPLVWIMASAANSSLDAYSEYFLLVLVGSFLGMAFAAKIASLPTYANFVPSSFSLSLSSLIAMPLFRDPMCASISALVSALSCTGVQYFLHQQEDVRRSKALSVLLSFLEGEAMLGRGSSEAFRAAASAPSLPPIGPFITENLKRLGIGLRLRPMKEGLSSLLSWLTISAVEAGELNPTSLSRLSSFSKRVSELRGRLNSRLYPLMALAALSPFLMAFSLSIAGSVYGSASSISGLTVLVSTSLESLLLGKLSGSSFKFTLPLALAIPLALTSLSLL
ncbi:hypothetical protein PQ610_02310 [Tardisphaera miroshnichenkoae]